MIYFNGIKKAVNDKRIRFRLHAVEMMQERNISRIDVVATISNGLIIEEYESDKPFASCLVFYLNNERPIHVVCAYNDIDDFAIIITVYIPDKKHFEDDFRTRRKK